MALKEVTHLFCVHIGFKAQCTNAFSFYWMNKGFFSQLNNHISEFLKKKTVHSVYAFIYLFIYLF